MAGELASQIGTRIRQAREELGLKQRQLADRIESDAVNNQRISDWERGVNQPSERYMLKIAQALAKEVSWFYETDATSETGDLMGALGPQPDPSQLDRIEVLLTGLAERLDRIERFVTPRTREGRRVPPPDAGSGEAANQ